MNMKKLFVPAITLVFALATAGAVAALTLSADADRDNPLVIDGPARDVQHGDLTYEDWLSNFGDETILTSIDDINPNICNTIHNINGCTAEELEEMGMAINSGAIEVEVKREPLNGEGEPGYVQSAENECSLEQSVYVTSGGQVGCIDVFVADDGGQYSSQVQPPAIMPQVLPYAG